MFTHKPRLTLLLLAAVLFAACQKAPQIDPAAKAAAEVERLAAILESPDRQKWQMPERVITELKLKNGQVIADIGAGTGYFTVRLARAVPQGKVLAKNLHGQALETFVTQYLERR